MRIAIIYHYFEANETYKRNFIYFLNNAITPGPDYFVFISGKCTVNLSEYKNVTYFFINNYNYDFGAVTKFYNLRDSDKYETYIFINSSVRGPFLPTYYDRNWYRIFTDKLSGNIGLVGSSINIPPEDGIHSIEFKKLHEFKTPFIHVQTAAYALSAAAFDELKRRNFFKPINPSTKLAVICNYEILMSQLLMDAGFALSSLLPTLSYFTEENKDSHNNILTKKGDVLFKCAFHGRSVSPLDCLFVKTNRDMISHHELCSYTFTALFEKAKNLELNNDGIQLFNYAFKCAVSSREKKGRSEKIDTESLEKKLLLIKHFRPELAEKIRNILG